MLLISTFALSLGACGGGGGGVDGGASPAAPPAAPDASGTGGAGTGGIDTSGTQGGGTQGGGTQGGGTDGGGTGGARDDGGSGPVVDTFRGPNFTFAVGETLARQRSAEFDAAVVELFDGFLQPLNDVSGLLPRTVPVTYDTCGTANAFYDPNARNITICDELTSFLFERYGTVEGIDENTAVELAFTTLGFVLYHESGHAFDDLLDLPLAGNIESAADSIATVLSVETDQSILGVLGAVLFGAEPESFGDEHGGGEDRAGDIYCWTLGGDSRLVFDPAFIDLVREFANAGRDCTAEYAGQRASVLGWLPGFGRLQPKRSASVPLAAALGPNALGPSR